MTPKSKYTGSFTSGALLHREFLATMTAFREDELLTQLDVEIEQNRYIAIKTENARKKIVREMKKRIANAPAGFRDFFLSISEAEQKLALFYLCLKTYYLIFDLHFEVTLPKWKLHSLNLESYDIQMRMDVISSFDEQVNGWSAQTKEKLNQIYRKILTESGLQKDNLLIKPLGINPDFWHYFINRNEAWFIEACFHNRNKL